MHHRFIAALVAAAPLLACASAHGGAAVGAGAVGMSSNTAHGGTLNVPSGVLDSSVNGTVTGPGAMPGPGRPIDMTRFEVLDRDGDGFISPEEARASPALAQRFTELDRNHDGRLSRRELDASEPKRDVAR